jgi:hypothetical protein
VVPFLVLLPLAVQLSSNGGIPADSPSPVSLLTLLGPTALKTCGALGLVLFSGRLVLRRMFEVRECVLMFVYVCVVLCVL